MHHRKLASFVALVSVAALTVASAISSTGSAGPRTHDQINVVAARGGEDFEPNALIFSTFRFDPGLTKAHTGERLRVVDQDRSAEEPHTLTIVRGRDVPDTFEEIFSCVPCGEALNQHFATDPPTLKVNVGAPGLDAPGDSLLFFSGQSIGSTISADGPRTLWFVCALHPWMQGRIVVG
jgi:plastocyanin